MEFFRSSLLLFLLTSVTVWLKFGTKQQHKLLSPRMDLNSIFFVQPFDLLMLEGTVLAIYDRR